MVFKEVADKDSENLVALRGLSRVYEVLERWQGAVDVLDRQVQVITTERDKIDVLMRLATLHEDRFLKTELAAQRLEQVLDIDPTNEDAYTSDWSAPTGNCVAGPSSSRRNERHIAATVDRKANFER